MVGTALTIAGWFVSPAFGKVLEKAQKYLGVNYKLQKDAQDMIEELNHNLLFCQATVKEAEKRAIINNPPLQELLLRLHWTVLEAEYRLDNIEAASIKEEGQGKNKVRRVVSSSFSTVRNTFFPHDNLKSLKKVVDKLKKLYTDIPTLLNLVNFNKDNESHTHEVTHQRKTLSQLLREPFDLEEPDDVWDKRFKLISIRESWIVTKYCLYYLDYPLLGNFGVGKTAVPDAVYNNPEVQQTFESKGSEGVRCPCWPWESKGSEGVRCPCWPWESKGSEGVRCPCWPWESKGSEGVRCPYWPSESKESKGVRCPYCSSNKIQFDWESKPFDSEFPFLHSIKEFHGIPINHPFSFPIKSEFQFFHASLSLSFLFLALCERWRKLERILTAEMVSPHSPASPPSTPMTSTASSCSASSTPPVVNTTSTTPTSPIAAASTISVSVI